jgi:hypothetical protein
MYYIIDPCLRQFWPQNFLSLHPTLRLGDYHPVESGPPARTYQASLLFGGETGLPDLVANDQGGLDAYQSSAEIPGSGIIMIELQPVQ